MTIKAAKSLYEHLVTAGIRESDSASKKRALRLNNALLINAIVNTVVFGFIFQFITHDARLAHAIVVAFLVYVADYLLTYFGFTIVGRVAQVLSANAIVFFFACYLRGSEIELLLFVISVIPLMFFAWEERGWYILSVVSIGLIILGEGINYDLGFQLGRQYDLHSVRYFAIIATAMQLLTGFYYFLKLSIKFEKESQDYFRKLQVEHQKQLQTQKMSSLGEMAAGMAHEINNPLTGIIAKVFGLRTRLKSKVTEDDPVFSDLDKINSMIIRITRIIGALRNFSRDAAHDPSELVSLKGLIDEVMDLCRKRFDDAGIQITTDVPESVTIDGRPSDISQVILNLLNNSFDAVVGTGSPWVKVQVKITDDQSEILVEDSGPRLTPEIAEKIMEPFFTTKEIGKGSGLGLSVSKGLVEGHGGTLTLLPGTPHTTFQVLIPLARKSGS